VPLWSLFHYLNPSKIIQLKCETDGDQFSITFTRRVVSLESIISHMKIISGLFWPIEQRHIALSLDSRQCLRFIILCETILLFAIFRFFEMICKDYWLGRKTNSKLKKKNQNRSKRRRVDEDDAVVEEKRGALLDGRGCGDFRGRVLVR